MTKLTNLTKEKVRFSISYELMLKEWICSIKKLNPVIFTGGKQSGDTSQNNRHDENSGRIFVFGLFVYKLINGWLSEYNIWEFLILEKLGHCVFTQCPSFSEFK